MKKLDQLTIKIWVRFPSNILDQMIAFIVPVTVYIKSESVALSGVVFLVQWAPRVISTGLLGSLLDRYTSKSIFLISDISRAIVCAAIAMSNSLWIICIGSAFLMLLGGISLLGLEKVIASDKIDKREISQSHQQVALQLGQVAGPFVGGLVILWTPHLVAFSLIGLLFGLSALTLYAFKTTEPVNRYCKKVDTVNINPLFGIKRIYHNRSLRRLLAIGVMVNFVGGLSLAIAPGLIIGEFGGSGSSVGLVSGAGAFIGAVAAVSLATYVSRGGTTNYWLIKCSFVSLLISGFGMGFSPNEFVFSGMFGLWSAGVTVFAVWLRTERLKLVPADEVGSTIGAFVAVLLLSIPLSGLTLAVLGNLILPSQIMLVAALVIGIGVFVLLSQHRTQSRSRTSIHSDL